MRAVDTNVVVRLIVRDDPAQATAAEAYIAPGAWVSHLVLAETLWVLDAVYARSPAQCALAVELLLQHRSLVIERPDVVAAAVASFRADPKLGFSDCLIVEIARAAGHTPVGTFDRALAKVDGAERIRAGR
jgi:predicted nucleic-acid-binding protein